MRIRTLLAVLAVTLLTACTQSLTAPTDTQTSGASRDFGSPSIGTDL